MFVARRNGEPRQDPFPQCDKERISTKVVHDGNEKEMFQYEFRPEMWFACHPRISIIARQGIEPMGILPLSMQWNDSPNAMSPRISKATI